MASGEVQRRFRAMNTDVTVRILTDGSSLPAVAKAAEAVEDWFETVEATLSRFRPESELSRLNRSDGVPSVVSHILREVLTAALEAARSSGGLFDPTILPALMAAGYDSSFEELDLADQPAASVAVEPQFTWRDIAFNAGGRAIVPRGCAIDLGGIAKGWTVDRAVDGLAGLDHFLIDAGGDIRVRGNKLDGQPWTVGIQDPFAPDGQLTVIALHDAAIATSTVARRQWLRNGIKQHHIIDPRTRAPAQSGVTAVTVVSRSVAHAEVLAKTALLLGPTEGKGYLQQQPGAEGLMVLDDRRIIATSNAFGVVVG